MTTFLTTARGQRIPVVGDDAFAVTTSDAEYLKDPEGNIVKGVLRAVGATDDVTLRVTTKTGDTEHVRDITIQNGEYLDVIVYKLHTAGTTLNGATIYCYV